MKDKCGHDVTDPMWVYNLCVKNTSSMIEDHVTDQNDIKENPSVKKHVLLLVIDGVQIRLQGQTSISLPWKALER